jgi:hypothetical protein
LDLKKVQQKIKEMEDCLKTFNIENDNIKGKLGDIISNLNTESNNLTDNEEIKNNNNNNNLEESNNENKNNNKNYIENKYEYKNQEILKEEN